MNEADRYQTIDLPFYRQQIEPMLPPEILDFHTHIWLHSCWKQTPWQTNAAGGKYMVVEQDYGIGALMADGKRIFPDKNYHAVCFGNPTPAADIKESNDYTAQAAGHKGLYPLLITGRDMIEPSQLEAAFQGKPFFGYKVFLGWLGNDYGSVMISDMIGPNEMRLAEELRLVVLLHVPRNERLADPDVQSGVQRLANEYPSAQIVLAHCGRAYLPDEMKRAIDSIKDYQNIYLDTSMVMEPQVLKMALDAVGCRRILFGTDFPVANMRGRRVYVMDHWVDVVLPGYAESAYRVASDSIRATFMAWEVVLAIVRAGEMTGLKREDLRTIFFENGMRLLKNVMDGEQLKKLEMTALQ